MWEMYKRRREPNRDIRQLYFINILRCMPFYMPIIIAYYADVIKVDFAGFMLGEAFFAAGMVLLEVPTGYLSDIWKRRVTMIVSGWFWFLGTAYMLVAGNLFDVIVAQLLMAVGASFSSGTAQAMLYEYLAEQGREAEFRKCEGKRFAYGFYTLAIVSLPAGLLYKLNPYLPVALSAVTQFFMVLATYRLREPERVKRSSEHHPFRDLMSTMKYALYGRKEIAAIIMLTAFMLAGTKLLLWIQQPYFMAAGIPVEWYGLLSCAAFGIIGINGQLVHMLGAG